VRPFEAHAATDANRWLGDDDSALLQVDGPGRTLAIFQGFGQHVLERLALPSNTNTGLVEQFRKLAATLHHAQTATGIRTVMVTSAVAGEGKTLTATNLALTLAESFRRNVLLVDADLRRPALHDVFQVPNVSGLSDGLKSATEGKLSLIQISPLLTLLTAGRPDADPMHSLISDRMKRVIEEARAKFDWVILDTPPVGLLTDANLLAAMVDTALLVVRASTAPHHYIERASEIIGRDRIIGIVLNAVPPDSIGSPDDYYHYQRYYGSRPSGRGEAAR
jgi:capsular exopolysaccharide synthesis family protein